MKLSEMTEILRAIRVSPVKSLGQNFLHDQNLARWIIDQAALTPEDYVVEIGPGLGALTEIALATGARVLAIEKDGRLANFLRERLPDGKLEVLHADALKFDPRTLYAHKRVKLVGNLPYYVSSQILLKFLRYPSPISLWLLMLQKEMARRLTASPATSDYGALTLQIQLRYQVDYLRTVAPSVFLPKPDVDSALVRISPRDPLQFAPCDHVAFAEMVRLGFSQRRKQLGKILGQRAPDWQLIASELGFNPRARAEELSLPQWIALTNRLTPLNAKRDSDEAEERFAIVDGGDQVVGVARRAQVHANNSLHRAVHILVFNQAGEVFLQKRSRWKDRHPLAWDSSAAGHVLAGEEYDQAAKRELREELGIDVPLERMAKLPASARTGHEFIVLYRGLAKTKLKPDPYEIEAGEFFPPSVVDQWVEARPSEFAPGFLECWGIWRQANR